MASKNHENLAAIIVKEIMEAQDGEKYRLETTELLSISNANKYATERSRLECDLRRYIKDEPWSYFESDIEETVQILSKKLGKQVHFRTKPLWKCLVNKLSKELQNKQELWQTAKIIYSLGTLYFENDEKENLSNIVYSIKDDEQRRNAVICARVYFDGYEKVFDFFSPDNKI